LRKLRDPERGCYDKAIMKRSFASLVVLLLAIIGGALVYQAARQERLYRALLAQGDAALRKGETYGAIEAYSGAITLRSDSMLAHLRRGESYRQRNEFENAARDFRVASELDPSALRPLEALGDVEYERQRYQRAAQLYEARLRLDERSAPITYKLALARYRAGNIDAALEALAQTLKLDDQMADAYYLLGFCHRERGRTAEALRAFEKAVAISPAMIPAREELAELFAALGRRADELEQLQVIAGIDRSQVERQVAVSLAHAKAGRGEVAVLTLANALERSPDQPAVYEALGRIWLNLADLREDALSRALESLEPIASRADASSDVLTLYGRALLKAGESSAAEQALLQATRRFPVDQDAFLAYADAAERESHDQAARDALIDYSALVPADHSAPARAARIGRLSLRVDQPAIALPWLERASAGMPGDVGVLTLLAEAQLKTGDLERARATVKSALEKDPANAALLALARRAR
jgi:tetratricopeptide (TPR) repeat protein